jgi:hypothetical protein
MVETGLLPVSVLVGPLRSRIAVALLLVLVAAALVLPVWCVKYPPLLDYPNHLARAFILTHLHDPGFQFARWFKADWGPYPYLGTDLPLVVLLQVLPAAAAGKVYLSLCLVGLPLACWWFLRQANPGNDALALWSVFAASNPFFLEGFLAFQFGLIFCFLALGVWVRGPRTSGQWVLLLTLTTATCISHFVAFVLFAVVATSYAVFTRRSLRACLGLWLVCLPGAGMFLWSMPGLHEHHALVFRDADDKLASAPAFLFGTFSQEVVTWTGRAAVACLALAWLRNAEHVWRGAWLGVTATLVVLYAVLPTGFGISWDIDVRVLPVALVVILATASVGRRARWIGAVALVLFAVKTADLVTTVRAEDAELQAIGRGVALIPAGARVLPLVQPHMDRDPIARPIGHFSCWVIIERGAFTPYLFDLAGQTPLRVTEQLVTPDGYWESHYEETAMDWPAIQAAYDYLWVYNLDRFAGALDRIGMLEYRAGLFRLYRVRRGV